jgi:hypothetical protein
MIEMWLAIVGAFVALIASVYISEGLNYFTFGQPINSK